MKASGLGWEITGRLLVVLHQRINLSAVQSYRLVSGGDVEIWAGGQMVPIQRVKYPNTIDTTGLVQAMDRYFSKEGE